MATILFSPESLTLDHEALDNFLVSTNTLGTTEVRHVECVM